MLSFRVARPRLRSASSSFLPRTYFSTFPRKRPVLSSAFGKKIAAGCAITVPGLWYLINSRADVTPEEVTQDNVTHDAVAHNDVVKDDVVKDDVPQGDVTQSDVAYGNMTLKNIPYLESPPTDHWDVEPGPSKEQVTSILSQGAYSFPVTDLEGVVRYDGAQLASNSPCEDHFIHGKLPSLWNDGRDWMAWGVFDGHVGGQTAELLKEKLLPFVRHSLNQVKHYPDEEWGPEELIQYAIMTGFQNLDDSIIETALVTSQSEESLPEKVKRLAPAFSGSYALLSLYDPSRNTLHVAFTGDSRAVLGLQRPDGKWEALPVSVDQNGFNEEEVARIYNQHPGEDNIVDQERVLGLGVS